MIYLKQFELPSKAAEEKALQIIVAGLQKGRYGEQFFESYYPCRYHSTTNRKRNRLRRCRHEMSGFHRSRAGVQPREDCAVIHRPTSTAQTVR